MPIACWPRRALLDGIDAELREHEQTRQQRDEQALAQRERISQASWTSRRWCSGRGTLQGRGEGRAVRGRAQHLPEAAWATGSRPCTRSTPHAPAGAGQPGRHPRVRRGRAAQEYLDSQNVDLTTALETLEDAIRKIDRETRGRFKDTFDRVNAGVQALYPRLFGGGHAYLELTGEDLLDTGVTIMARPPGKRVSSISLLSGGEKAMTAVALVFAIFQLNPAPFCLLDEVDAPLDEANVGRLANMVKEMSEKVQFLFVSHNKATMEAAHQLSGVTMREPGVSRLVSVDLEEAARLAGAA
jgi:chromosome segregation protein